MPRYFRTLTSWTSLLLQPFFFKDRDQGTYGEMFEASHLVVDVATVVVPAPFASGILARSVVVPGVLYVFARGT